MGASENNINKMIKAIFYKIKNTVVNMKCAVKPSKCKHAIMNNMFLKIH